MTQNNRNCDILIHTTAWSFRLVQSLNLWPRTSHTAMTYLVVMIRCHTRPVTCHLGMQNLFWAQPWYRINIFFGIGVFVTSWICISTVFISFKLTLICAYTYRCILELVRDHVRPGWGQYVVKDNSDPATDSGMKISSWNERHRYRVLGLLQIHQICSSE